MAGEEFDCDEMQAPDAQIVLSVVAMVAGALMTLKLRNKKKIIGVLVIGGGIVVLGLAIFAPEKGEKPSQNSAPSVYQSVSVSGSNGGVVNQSAVASGTNGVAVNQSIAAGGSSTVNVAGRDMNVYHSSPTNEAIAALEYLEKRLRPEYANEFPYGYTLFTLAGNYTVPPIIEGYTPLGLNWETFKVVTTTKRMEVILPDISVEGGGFVSFSSAVFLRREIGAEFKILYDPEDIQDRGFQTINNVYVGNISVVLSRKPTVAAVVRVVESQRFGYVVLLGLKPYDASTEGKGRGKTNQTAGSTAEEKVPSIQMVNTNRTATARAGMMSITNMSVVMPGGPSVANKTNMSCIAVLLQVDNAGEPSTALRWRLKVRLPSGKVLTQRADMESEPVMFVDVKEGVTNTVTLVQRAYLPRVLGSEALRTGGRVKGWAFFRFETLPRPLPLGSRITLEFDDVQRRTVSAHYAWDGPLLGLTEAFFKKPVVSNAPPLKLTEK